MRARHQPLRLFWWAPLRQRGVLISQVRQHGQSWAHSALRTLRPFTNFGDELSRLVFAEATGRRVEWASPQDTDHVAIGSVLGRFGMRDEMPWVLGAGLIGPPDAATTEIANSNQNRFLAVRGPATAQALGLPGDVLFADPGLLAMRLIGNRPRRKTGVLVIPHFQAWGSLEGRKQLANARSAGFRVIHPSSSPLTVLLAIAASEMVLSSSLHGVIVAHALGTPADLLSIPNGRETFFKYGDYFGAMNSAPQFNQLGEYLNRNFIANRMEVARELVAPFSELAHTKADRLVDAMRSVSI